MALRKTQAPAARADGIAAILMRLGALVGGIECRSLGLYWPIRREIDLRGWAAALAAGQGVELAMPAVVQRAAALEYRSWRPGAELVPDAAGIPAPAGPPAGMPDAIIAPLVGFRDLYRLGYGGGYFDRTLAACPRRPFAIGVGFEFCELASFTPEPHDIPMNAVVTERRLIRA